MPKLSCTSIPVGCASTLAGSGGIPVECHAAHSVHAGSRTSASSPLHEVPARYLAESPVRPYVLSRRPPRGFWTACLVACCSVAVYRRNKRVSARVRFAAGYCSWSTEDRAGGGSFLVDGSFPGA